MNIEFETKLLDIFYVVLLILTCDQFKVVAGLGWAPRAMLLTFYFDIRLSLFRALH